LKLRFRVVSVTLQEHRDGGRAATVRLVPARHEDNRAIWELSPAGSIELHGVIPRTTEELYVGADIDVTLEEAAGA